MTIFRSKPADLVLPVLGSGALLVLAIFTGVFLHWSLRDDRPSADTRIGKLMRAGLVESQGQMQRFIDDPNVEAAVKRKELADAGFRQASTVLDGEVCDYFLRDVVEPNRGRGSWQIIMCKARSEVRYQPGAPL